MDRSQRTLHLKRCYSPPFPLPFSSPIFPKHSGGTPFRERMDKRSCSLCIQASVRGKATKCLSTEICTNQHRDCWKFCAKQRP